CHHAGLQQVFLVAAPDRRAEVRASLGVHAASSSVSMIDSPVELLKRLPADTFAVALRGNLVLGAAPVCRVMTSALASPGSVVALESADPAHRGRDAAGPLERLLPDELAGAPRVATSDLSPFALGDEAGDTHAAEL